MNQSKDKLTVHLVFYLFLHTHSLPYCICHTPPHRCEESLQLVCLQEMGDGDEVGTEWDMCASQKKGHAQWQPHNVTTAQTANTTVTDATTANDTPTSSTSTTATVTTDATPASTTRARRRSARVVRDIIGIAHRGRYPRRHCPIRLPISAAAPRTTQRGGQRKSLNINLCGVHMWTVRWDYKNRNRDVFQKNKKERDNTHTEIFYYIYLFNLYK